MERVTRTRFTDEAYRHLRAAITSGELPEGAQLRGEELAQQLGLSRTPVREALLRLEADRLVEVRRGRAATVRVIGVKEALDAIDVFWTLSRRAYALAGPRLTDEELASIEAGIDEAARIAAQPDARPVDALDVLAEAQEVIIRASGNDELVHALHALQPRCQRVSRSHVTVGLSPRSLQRLREQVAAFRRADHDRAVELLDEAKAELYAVVAADLGPVGDAPAGDALPVAST